MKISLLTFGLWLSCSALSADFEPTLLGGRNIDARFLASVNDYRVGDVWGKHPIRTLDQAPAYSEKIVQATARVGGGTGWFLGYFGGKAVMASNYHVCQGGGCQKGSNVKFPMSNITLKVDSFYGSWTETDIAIFSVNIPKEHESFFKENARPFNFDRNLTTNLPLMTFGFGVANNTGRLLMGGYDEDCRVLSDDIRFIADPDELNPGPYKVYSFANGCDVSHGDSGSAMVDKTNGEVIGIIWTGRIPKNKKAQISDEITKAVEQENEDFIWKEMSYGAPATEIKKVFEKVARETKNNELKTVLADMLGK